MATLIPVPHILQAAGNPSKLISEFVGRLATGTAQVSVAVMVSPSGWSEPGQRPEFDEYTVVLEGEILVESDDGSLSVAAGQAVHAPAGRWVRYSTPNADGARYVAICIPAFAPELVNRDNAPT
jgi:uncharacterized cupin superfamily protein